MAHRVLRPAEEALGKSTNCLTGSPGLGSGVRKAFVDSLANDFLRNRADTESPVVSGSSRFPP